MAYKTVTVKHIADRIHRSRGFDPDQVAMTVKERERYGDVITRHLRRAWDEAMWPQLMALEQRTYRPPWDATVNYSAGHQVWDATNKRYRQSLQDDNTGHTPAAAGEDDDWWGEVEDFVKYIAFEQPWETTAIDEDGVDVREFAYYTSPLGDPEARRVAGCRRLADCIIMPRLADVPDEVWIRFRPIAPRFSLAEWSDSTEYARGDVCYYAADGNCYQASAPTTGETPGESGSSWAAVGFPDMFQDFVVLACLAELQSDDEGRYKTRALAEEELERVAHKKLTQAGEAPRVSIGRRR